MHNLTMTNAIQVLNKLFFEESTKNEYLAIKALEVFVALNFHRDIRSLAK
jgi:hypothetical protein